MDQKFGELVSVIYRKIVISLSHGYTLNDLKNLKTCRPQFSEYLVSFKLVLWQWKSVGFPLEYLIQLFDGAALLHLNVKIMESSALDILGPENYCLMVETHHGRDMHRAEEVLWLEVGCPSFLA